MTTILSSYIRDTSPTIHDIAFIQREGAVSKRSQKRVRC